MNQRGQTTPLLALAVLLAGGILFVVIRFGAVAAHVEQAQSAADAAALAGAAGGRAEAEALAAANGASLDRYERDGHDVEVRVSNRNGWAIARARRSGGGAVTGWVGTADSGGAGSALAARLREALAAAADLLHQPVPVVRALGTAVDVPGSFADRLQQVADRVGLCRRPSRNDPVRFALCDAET